MTVNVLLCFTSKMGYNYTRKRTFQIEEGSCLTTGALKIEKFGTLIFDLGLIYRWGKGPKTKKLSK